jgi:hypothetical protein
MLVEKLEELFVSRTPFAFSRFNDGEIGGILLTNFIASRGAQRITTELRLKLIEAIKFKKKQYWIGIPCPICYPEYFKAASELVDEYEYKTLAVNLINRNYTRTKQIFNQNFKGRDIYWVGGEDQNIKKVAQEYSFNLINQYKLPKVDSASSYEDFKNLYTEFKKESIVIVSSGPLERVLVKEWFEKNDSVTYLGLGSFFDPLTRGEHCGYHSGVLKKCTVCN